MFHCIFWPGDSKSIHFCISERELGPPPRPTERHPPVPRPPQRAHSKGGTPEWPVHSTLPYFGPQTGIPPVLRPPQRAHPKGDTPESPEMFSESCETWGATKRFRHGSSCRFSEYTVPHSSSIPKIGFWAGTGIMRSSACNVGAISLEQLVRQIESQPFPQSLPTCFKGCRENLDTYDYFWELWRCIFWFYFYWAVPGPKMVRFSKSRSQNIRKKNPPILCHASQS